MGIQDVSLPTYGLVVQVLGKVPFLHAVPGSHRHLFLCGRLTSLWLFGAPASCRTPLSVQFPTYVLLIPQWYIKYCPFCDGDLSDLMKCSPVRREQLCVTVDVALLNIFFTSEELKGCSLLPIPKVRLAHLLRQNPEHMTIHSPFPQPS